jgi:hypothetical protein
VFLAATARGVLRSTVDIHGRTWEVISRRCVVGRLHARPMVPSTPARMERASCVSTSVPMFGFHETQA